MAQSKATESYKHREKAVGRPTAGVEMHFKDAHGARKPVAYRYDSSLAPEMRWDESPARGHGRMAARRDRRRD